MEQKKPTNAQLQRRIAKAIVHVDQTKDTKSVFFSDKGLRLTVNEDYAVIETGYHRHVFSNFTSAGVSRPYLYTKRIIEIALLEAQKDAKKNGGYSYQGMLDVLKAKEDKAEYNIAVYFEWYCRTCFDPLYSIGESEVESFIVYLNYLFGLAKNAILLDEQKEDLTNKAFIEKLIDNIKAFTEGIDERVILPQKTDEERVKEEIEAIQERENEEAMEAQQHDA